MENKTRQPFKKYKELRVYFCIRRYSVLQYDCEDTEFALTFDWFKFSSRGVIFKDKNSGMEIHFKYSSVDSVTDSNNSRALILEDVELFTPFIKENDKIKFITWDEWNEKYNTESICKRITTVTDEHLKEHGTDLMYILDKLCTCASDRTFDHPHRFIKVEPRYQDNEYSLHRVAADFKWHHGFQRFDYIRYLFEYEAKNRTIHIDISKHETNNCPLITSGLLLNTMMEDRISDAYSISVEFNKDYSISNVTVKNKNKENLLKFMEMGNPVIKDTIRSIMNYINAKLTEKQLTSCINTSTEEDMYTQTWNFSPRVDVRPYTESIRKASDNDENDILKDITSDEAIMKKIDIKNIDSLWNGLVELFSQEHYSDCVKSETIIEYTQYFEKYFMAHKNQDYIEEKITFELNKEKNIIRSHGCIDGDPVWFLDFIYTEEKRLTGIYATSLKELKMLDLVHFTHVRTLIRQLADAGFLDKSVT